MSNIKNSITSLNRYRKNRKISLCNNFFKKDMNHLKKKNNCSKNISKRKITSITFNDDEMKNNLKIITSYFNTKFPSPRKPKGNIFNKNKSLIRAYKTLHNSKYFAKKIPHLILLNNNKK